MRKPKYEFDEVGQSKMQQTKQIEEWLSKDDFFGSDHNSQIMMASKRSNQLKERLGWLTKPMRFNQHAYNTP